MDSADPNDLTGLLRAVRGGDSHAEEVLFERVFNELHRMAHGRLLREHHSPTLLQTTALVNEAYVRLVRSEPSHWENRRHFFGAAVRAMRRILVEYARSRKAERRGGGVPKITLTGDLAAPEPSYDILALNEALDRLTGIRPRAAKVVGFRFFLGLNVNETAELLQVAPRTVDSDWQFANAWLRRQLAGSSGQAGNDSNAP